MMADNKESICIDQDANINGRIANNPGTGSELDIEVLAGKNEFKSSAYIYRLLQKIVRWA